MKQSRLALCTLGVVMVVGALAGRATLFIRPWFVPVVLLAGGLAFVAGLRRPGHGSRISAALLLSPVLLAIALPPSAAASPLGGRVSMQLPARLGDASNPLAGGRAGPVTLLDILLSESAGGAASLVGRRVTVEGVSDGTRLTRLVMVCCAADARAVALPVLERKLPRSGTWVRVTGTLTIVGEHVAVAAATVTQIALPQQPVL